MVDLRPLAIVTLGLALSGCATATLTDGEYMYCAPISTTRLITAYNDLSGDHLTVEDFVKQTWDKDSRDDARWVRACKALYEASHG